MRDKEIEYISDAFYYSEEDEFNLPPNAETLLEVNMTCSANGDSVVKNEVEQFEDFPLPSFIHGVTEDGLLNLTTPDTVGESYK